MALNQGQRLVIAVGTVAVAGLVYLTFAVRSSVEATAEVMGAFGRVVQAQAARTDTIAIPPGSRLWLDSEPVGELVMGLRIAADTATARLEDNDPSVTDLLGTFADRDSAIVLMATLSSPTLALRLRPTGDLAPVLLADTMGGRVLRLELRPRRGLAEAERVYLWIPADTLYVPVIREQIASGGA